MVRNLLKGGEIHENIWQTYTPAEENDSVGAALPCQVIFPLPALLEDANLVKGCKEYAVSVSRDDKVADLKPFLSGAAFIAVEFPSFADGRGFSLARLIRRELGWQGELRAIGNVLADQYAYMLECGFDAFEINHNRQTGDLFKVAETAIGMKYQTGTADTTAKDIRRMRQG